MRPAPLPSLWTGLDGKVQFVQRVSNTEYSSSCPRCGGEPHPNGEWPDRCRIFVDEKPLLWCRRCGYMTFPDQLEGAPSLTPAELEQFRQKQQQRAESRLRSAARELELLRDRHLWQHYHELMDARARSWWRGRGVPDAFQAFWQLGWDADTSRWGCQSATIPLFDTGWDCLNIKHRLTDDSKGRYRYNVTGLPGPLFLCDPDAKPDNHVIAVEGEIKSMVVAVTLDEPGSCVVGIPGLASPKSISEYAQTADRVTLVLDPGADRRGADGWSPMGRLVKDIGRDKTRVLVPPMKIDDGILTAGLTKAEVRSLLDTAVRV
jgi:hypothetical protein